MPADALKEAYRARFDWMAEVLADPTLTNGEKVVAMRLALHKNVKTARCDPSIQTIADGVAMGRRNTQYTLSRLEEKHRVKRRVGGQGPRQTTQYELLRVQRSAPLDEPGRVHENEVRAQKATPKDAEILHDGRATLHPNLNNNKENLETVSANKHPGDFQNRKGEGNQELTDADIDTGFEEFWRQCPRAVDKGKARLKYLNALKTRQVTIAELLHAMMLYSAAREEADQDHYTKTPANWLANECWNDDPEAHALGSGRGKWGRRVREWLKEASSFEPMSPFDVTPTETGPRAEEPASSEVDPRWTTVQAALAVDLGDQLYKRYFLQVVFEAVVGGVVYLRTLAPYDARKIETDYKEILIKHWQTQDAGVRTIVVSYGRLLRRAG
jgi:hypothetical protein